VAHDCGFGAVDRMRLVFQQRLGVTPAHYRASFRRSDASSAAASGSQAQAKVALP
jgi:transcriptional regulator GlxA family with amidase domain